MEEQVGGCDFGILKTPTHGTSQVHQAEVAAKALSEHMMSLKLWDECLGES